MKRAVFIYFHRESGCAVAYSERDDLSTGQLLFTCPEDWKPLDQKQFEAAAKFYGVKNPERMKYDPEEVPF